MMQTLKTGTEALAKSGPMQQVSGPRALSSRLAAIRLPDYFCGSASLALAHMVPSEQKLPIQIAGLNCIQVNLQGHAPCM